MIQLTDKEIILRAEAMTRVLLTIDTSSRAGRQTPVGAILPLLNETFSPDKGSNAFVLRLAVLPQVLSCRGGLVWFDAEGHVGVALLGVGQNSGPQLISGWVDSRSMNRDAAGFNTAAYASAATIIAAGTSIARGQRVTGYLLYGHSGGGVCAEAVAYRVGREQSVQTREIQTFGAPKPSLGGSYRVVGRGRTRWMNTGDPVPGIPFLATGARTAIALDLAGVRYRPDLMGQPPGGRILSRDGSYITGDEADTPMDTSIGNVASWLAGQDESGGFPHSLSTYNAWLNAALERTEAGQQQQPPKRATTIVSTITVENEPSRPAPAGLQNGAVVAINGRTATSGGGQRLPITIGSAPMSSLATVDPRLRVKKQRSGGVFLVLWDDVIIGTCASASAANQVARSINRMCRTFGKTTSLSQANFFAYMQMFLAAAAQIDGGVRPPINVT